MTLNIRPATNTDLEDILNLLSANQLPTIDMNENSVQLFVALFNNELIGTIGIEKFNQLALLRSLAVKDKFKNQKVGEQLVNYLFDFSKVEHISELYLLTTTAEKYFYKFGFHKIDRLKVPEIIMQTREFKDICPLSAVVMQRKL